MPLLFENGCFFYLKDMDLEESIDIILDVIRNKTENRLYDTYMHSMLIADEKHYLTYEEFLNKQGFLNKNNSKVDIEKKRKKANDIVNSIFGRK